MRGTGREGTGEEGAGIININYLVKIIMKIKFRNGMFLSVSDVSDTVFNLTSSIFPLLFCFFFCLFVVVFFFLQSLSLTLSLCLTLFLSLSHIKSEVSRYQ